MIGNILLALAGVVVLIGLVGLVISCFSKGECRNYWSIR